MRPVPKLPLPNGIVYITLRVSGLTQLALTVVGGTGLIGLAVGIAFRDITENFLASIFLSMQRPFETGDLVEVAGVTGYVQQLNIRTTIVMTLDGNLKVSKSKLYKLLQGGKVQAKRSASIGGFARKPSILLRLAKRRYN